MYCIGIFIVMRSFLFKMQNQYSNIISMIELTALINLLNNQYLNNFNTVMVGGFDEPFYKASTESQAAEIQFSHNYIRSALHELSHWCVAGVERRKIDDFGYWYASDGRNQQQQNEFFKVEIKPQAIEWAFSIVLGVRFEASVDNLNTKVDGIDVFKKNLKKQLLSYCDNSFPKRTDEILKLFAKNQGKSEFIPLLEKSVTQNH